MEICAYGCGQHASFQFGNGKFCCSVNVNKCPAKRQRDIDKKTGKPSGRKGKTAVAWNRGLTASHPSVKKGIETLRRNLQSGVTKPAWQGKHHSESSKANIAKKLRGNRNGQHRGDRQSFYCGIRMDSSWEVKVAEYLDSKKLDWKYSLKSFVLSDGSTILPDFFLMNGDTIEKIVEVKGYFREANKRKFEMFLREYPELKIELWNKEKLKELGVFGTVG